MGDEIRTCGGSLLVPGECCFSICKATATQAVLIAHHDHLVEHTRCAEHVNESDPSFVDVKPLVWNPVWVVTVWTDEWDTEGIPPRAARVYGTGQPVPAGDVHLGSCLDGPMVWHVFAANPSPPPPPERPDVLPDPVVPSP